MNGCISYFDFQKKNVFTNKIYRKGDSSLTGIQPSVDMSENYVSWQNFMQAREFWCNGSYAPVNKTITNWCTDILSKWNNAWNYTILLKYLWFSGPWYWWCCMCTVQIVCLPYHYVTKNVPLLRVAVIFKFSFLLTIPWLHWLFPDSYLSAV